MPTADIDSILTSTKKSLGIAADYDYFDLDIINAINSVLSTLTQLGVGPLDDQLLITDADDTWASLLGTQKNLNSVKSYIFLRVRMLFDPPVSGFLITSIENQIKELEWRMNVAAESIPNKTDSDIPVTTPPSSGPGDDGIWNLTGLDDFPAEAPVGAIGIDFSNGSIWRKSS